MYRKNRISHFNENNFVYNILYNKIQLCILRGPLHYYSLKLINSILYTLFLQGIGHYDIQNTDLTRHGYFNCESYLSIECKKWLINNICIYAKVYIFWYLRCCPLALAMHSYALVLFEGIHQHLKIDMNDT